MAYLAPTLIVGRAEAMRRAPVIELQRRIQPSSAVLRLRPLRARPQAAAAAPASPSVGVTSGASRVDPRRAAAGGPSSMGNLATYRLPQRRPHQRWLDTCIRDAVGHLNEAPFLQATCTAPQPQTQRFTVSPEVADAPQLWDGIVRHLSGTAASSVLYVSPVALGGDSGAEQPAISCFQTAACDSAREVLTGMATGDNAALLTGSVGNCCEGHDTTGSGHFTEPADDFKHGYAKASQIVPYRPLSMRPAESMSVDEPPPPEGRMRSGSMSADTQGQLQRMWGVIVQSREHGVMEGCYLLRTLQSAAADCSCTHYTLTKVCDGLPDSEGSLQQKQLAGAWL